MTIESGSSLAQNTTTDLASFRSVAAKLSGASLDTKTVIEYATTRITNGCASQDGAEDKLTARGDGSLRLRRFRSFSESEQPQPGEFIGKAAPDSLRAVFGKLAKMDWVQMPAGMPPPGPSETIRSIAIVAGGKAGRYTLAGDIPPGQNLLEDGFDALDGLTASAKDTVWTLSLAAEKAHYKNGVLELDAVFRSIGSVKLVAPKTGKTEECGAVTLRWYEDKPEKPGVTPLPVEWKYATAQVSGGATLSLSSGKPQSLHLKFSVAASKGAVLKGRLVFPGAMARVPDEKGQVAVSLFSPQFGF